MRSRCNRFHNTKISDIPGCHRDATHTHAHKRTANKKLVLGRRKSRERAKGLNHRDREREGNKFLCHNGSAKKRCSKSVTCTDERKGMPNIPRTARCLPLHLFEFYALGVSKYFFKSQAPENDIRFINCST